MILAASSEAADHADSARVTASRAFEMAREAREAADDAESAARSVDCNRAGAGKPTIVDA
jgi:hypothetical protein